MAIAKSSTPTVPLETSAAAMTSAYQPILRGYFLVAAVYYAIMVFAHWLTMTEQGRIVMMCLSGISALFCCAASHYVRAPRSSAPLELITSSVNLIVLANVMAAMHFQFGEAKFVYFIMMTMIFAFACTSIRQAMLSIAITFACLYIQLHLHAPHLKTTYGFVGFASALAAVGITYFLRRTLAVALAERQRAEQDRLVAEDRLDAAEQLNDTIRQQSLTDSLTGLPNRRAFFDEFCNRRSAENGTDGGFWLILLDLDGFKAVNDNYGHVTGDALLRAVAERLRDMCGSNIYVSRIGGDEFNMMAPGDMPEAAVEAWCESLLACLAKSFLIDDRQVLISGSIGCCRSTADEGGIGLIQMADYALLHAKRSGRNRLTVFREEHASDATERFRIEQALRSADLSRELELLYQPQWDVRLQRIVAAEALARWNSPVLGPVSPSRFIMVAEESGLIANITLTVLNKVLATLQQAGQSLTLSMNLSGHDLLADDIVDNIIGRVAASGIDPAMLEFEITETALMPDIGRASANVARLARCGHPVALDDFGTGYSNFQYLRTLPISTLKVDRSFMVNATDVMTEKLLSSLAGMARTLGVQCLFEGVETEIELLLAKRAGAQLIQGYLIGKPMTWDQLTSMIGVDERADADFLRAANVR